MQDQRRQTDAERLCGVEERKIEAHDSFQKAGLHSLAVLQND